MKKNVKGFTMVELLVVLIIVAILAAIATPLYLTNVQRSRASEAVAGMGLIRQAERDFRINTSTYFDVARLVTVGNVQKPLPPLNIITLTTGALTTADTYGLNVDVGIPQYFSNAAFTVQAAGTGVLPDTDGASNLFVNPPAVDFIITVDGEDSIQCASGVVTNCAIKASEVNVTATSYILEMDNSGRIFVSYNNGTTWSVY